jgi:putative transposase
MSRILHEKDLRKGRCSQSGGLYLITKCLKRSHELIPDQRTHVVDALLYARSRSLILVHAFVVMPDHWHAVVSLGSEKTLSQAVWSISRRASFSWRRTNRVPVWQDGFHDHKVRENEPVVDVVRYVEANPVRKSFVAGPEDWPWSRANLAYAQVLDRAFLGPERW